MSGKEKQFLLWYFYHGSYSGAESFSEETINRFARTVSKPGFLRAMLGPFSTSIVYDDSNFFKSSLGHRKLEVPVLDLGGEASLGSKSDLRKTYEPISSHLQVETVPKAGHCIRG